MLPADAFETIVPVLLGLALVLVVMQPRIQAWVRRQAVLAGRESRCSPPSRLILLVVWTFIAGVYGGYFAAAQGILLVGIMGALVHNSLQEINAAKNLLSLLVNVVSASDLHAGGVRPDQLDGRGDDRGRLVDRRFHRCRRGPQAAGTGAARRDRACSASTRSGGS